MNGKADGRDGRSGRGRRERSARPLDEASLRELAVTYVARFATSRAKLVSYLKRKLREREWVGSGTPDADGVADRMVELGFIDDAAFAGIKASSLLRRGYGKGRVRVALQASGIDAADGCVALDLADEQAMDAALHFARRTRIGPFAPASLDLAGRQKALAAMLRAGHSMDLARRIVAAAPGDLTSFSAEG